VFACKLGKLFANVFCRAGFIATTKGQSIPSPSTTDHIRHLRQHIFLLCVGGFLCTYSHHFCFHQYFH